MKRYVPIAEYQRMTGLSYPTVKRALETGQLKGIQTEAGHWKIDTAASEDKLTIAVFERLDAQERMLKALCGHLGIASNSYEREGRSDNISYIGAK